MRGSKALKTGMFKLQQFVDQLNKSKAATTPGTTATNLLKDPTSALAQQFQAARNNDGFNNTSNLPARYAAMLQGAPPAQNTGSKQPSALQASLNRDSFQPFTKPPLALKSPDLPRQPAFVRV
jgi:hypothetical protein